MTETTKDLIKKIIISALLVAVAIYLLKYLLIPGIVASIVYCYNKRNVGQGFSEVGDYLMSVAVSIDQLGNVVCLGLFNYTLITSEGYKFGNPDETISGIIGKNEVLGTLSCVGVILNYILNKLDPNHSIDSIEKDETN